MTGDGKRLVVVHLGFSKIYKVAKNNLQSLKNSVLTCITHFIGPIINKSTRETSWWRSHLPRKKRNLVQLKPFKITSHTKINDVKCSGKLTRASKTLFANSQ